MSRGGAAHRNPSGDAGSVLLEAAVGTGLLAMVLASAAVVSVAAAKSSALAVERVSAAHEVAGVFEVLAVGGTLGTTGDGRTPGVAEIEVVEMMMSATLDPCAPAEGAGVSSVHLALPVRSGAGRVAIVGPVPARHGPPRLLVRLDTDLPAGAAPQLQPPGGAHPGATLVPTSSRCIASDVSAGPWEIALLGAPDLMDPLHRPALERPLTVDVVDGTTAVRWDVAEAANLTVDLDAQGARLPDEVPGGGIRWSVRGDDGRVLGASGTSRPVHPGRVMVVASVCGDPEAQGSTVALVLAPGEQRHVDLALATAMVHGVGHAPDARLELVRARACGDGSPMTPTIAWDGGLTDGMRIALPHGTWTALLRTSQATLDRQAVVVTDGDDVEVELR